MNVVLVGSAGRCGIREYSQVLLTGFRELGHRIQYIGVKPHDNRDLAQRIRQIRHDDELVIFEYEPGIFWLGGLLRAMAWLRFGQHKRVLLSVHEIAPEKYPEFRQIQWHLARPASRRGLSEIVKLFLSTGDVALRFLMLRAALLLMGWLPHAVVVHSSKAAENVHLALADDRKVHYVPLVVKQLDGDREALREQLGLPRDVFAFIIPGFLFRRKRIIEVIEQLPAGVELWIVGTPSKYDPGYLEEMETYLAHSSKCEQVRLIQDYDRMEQHLLAADATVLFYADAYQSAIASLAVGAGKPCIFSDLPAFSDLCEAGLVVRTPQELRQAMVEIQEPARYNQLVEAANVLREQLSPTQISRRYLDSYG
jgi:hypothetical protein